MTTKTETKPAAKKGTGKAMAKNAAGVFAETLEVRHPSTDLREELGVAFERAFHGKPAYRGPDYCRE